MCHRSPFITFANDVKQSSENWIPYGCRQRMDWAALWNVAKLDSRPQIIDISIADLALAQAFPHRLGGTTPHSTPTWRERLLHHLQQWVGINCTRRGNQVRMTQIFFSLRIRFTINTQILELLTLKYKTMTSSMQILFPNLLSSQSVA